MRDENYLIFSNAGPAWPDVTAVAYSEPTERSTVCHAGADAGSVLGMQE